MNIQDFIDHYAEVKDTLSNGLVGDRLRAHANYVGDNLRKNYPAIFKSNPTIDDLVDTSYNFMGPIGAIRSAKDIGIRAFNNHRTFVDSEDFRRFNKAHGKTYATENDRLVKLADNPNANTRQIADLAEMYGHMWLNNKDLDSVLKRFHVNERASDLGANLNTLGIRDSIESLTLGNHSDEQLRSMFGTQKAADIIRELFGGRVTATTNVGKFIENLNDITAASNLYNKKSKYNVGTKRDMDFLQKFYPRDFKMLSDKRLEDLDKISEVLNSDYYKQNKPNIFLTPNLGNNWLARALDHAETITPRMTLEDAILSRIRTEERERFALIKAQRLEADKKGLDSAVHVTDLANKHKLVKLTNENALKAEGSFQKHCAGKKETCDKVKSGSSEVYSIRDPDGYPLYTIEWKPKTRTIAQIRGRRNTDTALKHADLVKSISTAASLYKQSPQLTSFEDFLKGIDLINFSE